MRWKNNSSFALILLIAAGFAVYSSNLNNELFWDDNDWIKNNIYVHSFSWDNIKFWLTNNTLAGVGIKSNYYRPFLFFTFALNYVMSGIKPLGYHLLSNSIHIFNGVLVFYFINLILKRRLLAFLTALIFIIHPLQTEAVSYISGRGDMLAGMFILLALISFFKSQITKQGLIDKTLPGNFWKALSLVFLVFGLLSRETTIIFPFLALTLYVSFISKDRFLRSIKTGLIKTLPYFAVVIVYGVLRLTALNFLNTLNFYTTPNIYSENLHIRILTFLPILWGYIKLLFVPVGLHMERSVTIHTSLFQGWVWLIAIAVFSILYLVFKLYKKSFNTKPYLLSTDYKVWLFSVLWFFICLGPVSGITPINALMYEHWLYMPMIGFWLIISFYLIKLFDYLKSKKNVIGYWLLIIGLAVYLFFLGYQSIQRNILWGDEEKFYKDILKYEPDSARINNNLGNLYFNQNDKENAKAYYLKAIQGSDVFAQPHYNLGSMLQAEGDFYGAIQLYEEAIRIDPNFYHPYQGLTVIYAQQGNLTKAAENIEKLKIFLPNSPRIYYNSALIYIELNDKDQALKDLREGIKYTESDPETGKLILDLIGQLEK